MFDPETAAHTDSFLRQVIEEQGVLPEGTDKVAFTRALLANFASPDPVLRDELSYRLMAMVLMSGQLSLHAQGQLLRTALDESHLFYRIGDRESDSVFMRAFSVLMVPLVLEDSPHAMDLSVTTVAQTTEAVLRYARAEQDRRGYVDGKGWAHTAAHTADALLSCGVHPHTEEADCIKLLDAIAHLSMLPVPLAHLEDDRLAIAAFKLIQSGKVQDTSILLWLDSFQLVPDSGNDSEETIAGANAEHVLRSLYFRFLHVDEQSRWLAAVRQALSRFDIYQLYRQEDEL